MRIQDFLRRGAASRLHRDERGAILLFSLAAALILMIMSWVIYDTGPAARDKVELQGAADTAAYSQSATRARAMNLIAYGNVAKRSVIAITGLYPMMYAAYSQWMAYHFGKCHKTFPNLSSCYKYYTNLPQFTRETLFDFRDYAGIFWGLVWAESFGLIASPDGNVADYHSNDMAAIDNYQRYMFHVSPWWGWVEGVVRGMRNGATTTVGWPVPPGYPLGGFPDTLNTVLGGLSSVGLGSSSSFAARAEDRLPYQRGNWRSSDFTSGASAWESVANVAYHRQRSSRGARRGSVIAAGAGYYALFGWRMMRDEYGERGRPWLLNDFQGDEGKWMLATSTLTFAYLNKPDKFGADQQKYSVPSPDYQYQLGALDEFTYTSSGTWTMARSEISFQGDRPTPFRAGWTARMRPIALAGEWRSGQDLNKAYHDVLPFLALSSVLGIGDFNYFTASLHDFVAMERMTRSFGPSTVEGIGK